MYILHYTITSFILFLVVFMPIMICFTIYGIATRIIGKIRC